MTGILAMPRRFTAPVTPGLDPGVYLLSMDRRVAPGNDDRN